MPKNEQEIYLEKTPLEDITTPRCLRDSSGDVKRNFKGIPSGIHVGPHAYSLGSLLNTNIFVRDAYCKIASPAV